MAMSLAHLPAFLFSVFVFYWSLPLGVLLGRIHAFSFGKRENHMLAWATFMKDFFAVKVVKHGEQQLYTAGPCLYLANHRCWADFFLDVYFTEGRAAVMSRWMVAAAFPVFVFAVRAIRGIILFKRTTIADRQKFNQWLDDTLAGSPANSLLVYPEGHRSTRPRWLPLRRGMAQYAYSRKLPTQLIISRGKEDILSEKRGQMHFGATVTVGMSQVLLPRDYEDFEAFWKAVAARWESLWSEVYASEASTPLVYPKPYTSVYPFQLQAGLAGFSALGILLLLLLLPALLCKALLVFLTTFGALAPLLLAGLLCWTANSMWLSAKLLR